MPDDAPSRRLYQEREISRILKLASDKQQAAGQGEAGGLSLADLRQIAAETGIDPRFVEEAAAELEGAGEEERGFHLLGGPTSIVVERVVDGEVDEAQWEAIAAEASRTLGGVGQAGQYGRTLQWTHTGRTEQTQVSVTPRDGRTKIRVQSEFTRTAAVMIAPVSAFAMSIGFGMSASMGWPPLARAGFLLSMLLVLITAARMAFGALSRKKQRDARRLLQRIERLAPDTAAATPAATSTAAQIDPDLLTEAPQEERAPATGRRSRA